jgi:hypothetical protein
MGTATFTPSQQKYIKIISLEFADLQSDLEKCRGLDPDSLALNPRRVAQIVTQMAKDYHVMADHHGISPDHYKQAGFLTYWMCKKKPISIINLDEVYLKIPNTAYMLDEYLSLRCSIAIIKAANKNILGRKEAAKIGLHNFDKRVLDIGQMNLSVKSFLHILQNGNLTSLTLAMQYYYIDVTSANSEYLEMVNIANIANIANQS